MATERIESGDRVKTVDAFGETKTRRAISGVEIDGHDFPVVWVCSEDEWLAAQKESREPEGIPWPAEDVSVAAQSA